MSTNVRFYLSYDIKITLKSHFYRKKRYHFVTMYETLLWTLLRFPTICKQLVVLSILLHGVISLPDTTPYDKKVYAFSSKVCSKLLCCTKGSSYNSFKSKYILNGNKRNINAMF